MIRYLKVERPPKPELPHSRQHLGAPGLERTRLVTKALWVANKRFEISKFKFKIPRARTSELQGSFSAVSKPNFAGNYAFESSLRI